MDWEALPPCFLTEVARRLASKDKQSCRAACKHWRNVCSPTISAVQISISSEATDTQRVTSELQQAAACFPCSTAVKFDFQSQSSVSSLSAILTAIANAPAMSQMHTMTITALQLATAVPLQHLRPMQQLQYLDIQGPHNPHTLARLTNGCTNLRSINLSTDHLTTCPSNVAYTQICTSLSHSLQQLAADISTSTSDITFSALRKLTNLLDLRLTCSRHFASASGLMSLTSLKHLTHFTSSNLLFYSIPADLFPLVIQPAHLNPTHTNIPSWPTTFKALFSSWTRLKTLHLKETNLAPDIFPSFSLAPPSLRTMTLDIRYTSTGTPPTTTQAEGLCNIPHLTLELEPCQGQPPESYHPLLHACPQLQSLRLQSVTLCPTTLAPLAACPSLRHLSIHFTHAPPSTALTSALLAPLVHTPALLTLRLSAPRHMAACLAHLLDDTALGELLYDSALQAVTIRQQPGTKGRPPAAARHSAPAAPSAACLEPALPQLALPPAAAAAPCCGRAVGAGFAGQELTAELGVACRLAQAGPSGDDGSLALSMPVLTGHAGLDALLQKGGMRGGVVDLPGMWLTWGTPDAAAGSVD